MNFKITIAVPCLLIGVAMQFINSAYAFDIDESQLASEVQQSLAKQQTDFISQAELSKTSHPAPLSPVSAAEPQKIATKNNTGKDESKNNKLLPLPVRVVTASYSTVFAGAYGAAIGTIGVATLPITLSLSYMLFPEQKISKMKMGLTALALPVAIPIVTTVSYAKLGAVEGWHASYESK